MLSIMSQIGVGNRLDDNNNLLYHIYIIGNSGKKIFMCEDGSWTEDINSKAESSDFAFVFEILSSIFDSQEQKDNIDISLCF